MIDNILELNGLSVEILKELFYQSKLGMSIKKNLHYFARDILLKELFDMAEWYDEQILLELEEVALDYRIKSMESITSKYDRYYLETQVRKVFNDILGFRAFCDSYSSVLNLNKDNFRIADMSNGKSHDDGYRGVHVYFQKNSKRCPMEIQFNTLYDRQLNNWHGCYALKTQHGSHLVEMKRRMNQQVASKGIQLVTISRPTAYGEYAPYTFIENEEEFEKLVEKMK